MDYKAIYYRIIEKANNEDINGKRSIGYYEKHHIQPRSLGGNNNKENLVKLTAREHFICHWLLVKMYDKGTIERYKMLCALWRMRKHSYKNSCHYTNARVYEALRIEFAKTISKTNSINQQGNKNSQFGTKWYTNRNTGESKKFKEKPIEEFWIEGRNLFNGKELWSILYKRKIDYRYKSEVIKFCIQNNLLNKNGIISPNKLAEKDLEKRKQIILNCGINLMQPGWVNKVSKLTGLNRSTINNLVLSYPELKEKVYFKERIHTEEEWEKRKNDILNSNIDLTKPGWQTKIKNKLNITRSEIRNLLKHFPELKEKVYYKK